MCSKLVNHSRLNSQCNWKGGGGWLYLEEDIHMSSIIMRQMDMDTIWNWKLSSTNCMFHILGRSRWQAKHVFFRWNVLVRNTTKASELILNNMPIVPQVNNILLLGQIGSPFQPREVVVSPLQLCSFALYCSSQTWQEQLNYLLKDI